MVKCEVLNYLFFYVPCVSASKQESKLENEWEFKFEFCGWLIGCLSLVSLGMNGEID